MKYTNKKIKKEKHNVKYEVWLGCYISQCGCDVIKLGV